MLIGETNKILFVSYTWLQINSLISTYPTEIQLRTFLMQHKIYQFLSIVIILSWHWTNVATELQGNYGPLNRIFQVEKFSLAYIKFVSFHYFLILPPHWINKFLWFITRKSWHTIRYNHYYILYTKLDATFRNSIV